jgi:CBS domain-containing protein
MTSADIRDFLSQAAADGVTVPVRDLLAKWGFRARTYDSVARVVADLSASGLACTPGLGEGGLDTEVRVGPVAIPGSDSTTSGDAGEEDDAGAAEDDQQLELPAFTLRVADIPSAQAGVTAVNPNQTLADAQFLMVMHDYSQLPVLSGPRTLKGVISWQSIARASLAKPHVTLTDAVDPYPKVVYATQELLDQVTTIYDAGFVLVRGADQIITGIVTTADLARQFRDLTTPFFQLGDIEAKLRRCIGHAFSLNDIRGAVGSPRLESVAKMTFGQYIIVLQDPGRWEQMHWPAIPRALFISELDAVRQIRNRVMHFGVELEQADRTKLTSFLRLMGPLDAPNRT